LPAVAQRVVWFKEFVDALADPTHSLVHMMTYGTGKDLRASQAIIGLEEFWEVFEVL